MPVSVTEPRFFEELLNLNHEDVSFLLSDLHALLVVPDTRRPGPGPTSAGSTSSASTLEQRRTSASSTLRSLTFSQTACAQGSTS